MGRHASRCFLTLQVPVIGGACRPHPPLLLCLRRWSLLQGRWCHASGWPIHKFAQTAARSGAEQGRSHVPPDEQGGC